MERNSDPGTIGWVGFGYWFPALEFLAHRAHGCSELINSEAFLSRKCNSAQYLAQCADKRWHAGSWLPLSENELTKQASKQASKQEMTRHSST
jgi:hypothetical protein